MILVLGVVSTRLICVPWGTECASPSAYPSFMTNTCVGARGGPSVVWKRDRSGWAAEWASFGWGMADGAVQRQGFLPCVTLFFLELGLPHFFHLLLCITVFFLNALRAVTRINPFSSSPQSVPFSSPPAIVIFVPMWTVPSTSQVSSWVFPSCLHWALPALLALGSPLSNR